MSMWMECDIVRGVDNKNFRKEMAALLRKYNAKISRIYDEYNDKTSVGFYINGDEMFINNCWVITPETLENAN